MEGFFKLVKHEEMYLWEYETCQDVVTGLLFFSEEVYTERYFIQPRLPAAE